MQVLTWLIPFVLGLNALIADGVSRAVGRVSPLPVHASSPESKPKAYSPTNQAMNDTRTNMSNEQLKNFVQQLHERLNRERVELNLLLKECEKSNRETEKFIRETRDYLKCLELSDPISKSTYRRARETQLLPRRSAEALATAVILVR